jgi:amidohydrolase
MILDTHSTIGFAGKKSNSGQLAADHEPLHTISHLFPAIPRYSHLFPDIWQPKRNQLIQLQRLAFSWPPFPKNFNEPGQAAPKLRTVRFASLRLDSPFPSFPVHLLTQRSSSDPKSSKNLVFARIRGLFHRPKRLQNVDSLRFRNTETASPANEPLAPNFRLKQRKTLKRKQQNSACPSLRSPFCFGRCDLCVLLLIMNMKTILASFVSLPFVFSALAAEPTHEQVQSEVAGDLPYLQALYKHLHTHPELSNMETETSKRIAKELKEAGFEVTENFGGHGVVAVLRNGNGPTVLLRTDLDALPVKEQTGLPYASAAKQIDPNGNEVSVMHACGHDMHMSVFVGAARWLGKHTNQFQGTVVMIGQPAEERVGGAIEMLKAGLFERFPKPNWCLALHVASEAPAGTVGYREGYALANVDSMNITVRGVGGHGAFPQRSKDPIVLSAQIILAIQTVVSRELPPTEPAVVTVGSIHAGTKHNIIPDEVKLQLTLRSYADEVRAQMIKSIERIVRGLAVAAGVPEDRMPIVEIEKGESSPATYNNPELTQRWRNSVREWIGAENVTQAPQVMGAEDFGLFGRTEDKIPICMLWLGSAPAERIKSGKLPSIHSPFYYPDPEPTLKTGVTTYIAGVLDLLKKQ